MKGLGKRFGQDNRELAENFFFQAEDDIRDSVASRGLGDVYEKQVVDN